MMLVQELTMSCSIGLPPKGECHVDVDPFRMVFYGQSVKGSFISTMADIDETLDFAKRGKSPHTLANE